MIDIGLLLSVVAAVAMPSLLVRRYAPPVTIGDRSPLDVVLPAVGVGVVAGRLSALAFDDPGGLGQLSDVLVIRSGVEFWPGVAAAAVWIAVAARREGQQPLARLADLVPFALWGYGAYEATCVVREGCYGPVSAVGLRPEGLTVTMVPVGIAVALVVGVAAFGLSRLRAKERDLFVVVAAVGVVAATRSVASIWLPALGSGLTRQHRMSILIAVLAVGGLAAMWARKSVAADEGSPAEGVP